MNPPPNEMAQRFEEFYKKYKDDDIAELANEYPRDRKSLYIDWEDLYRFGPTFADDFLISPSRFLSAAEEALRQYDTPVDVTFVDAHVRITNLPETRSLRELGAEEIGQLVSIRGIIRRASDVRPRVRNAAFECLRCGTVTVVPQTGNSLEEPYQCNGCEREGPFQFLDDGTNTDYIDIQKVTVADNPRNLPDGKMPEQIDITLEDDLAGTVTVGESVTATGVYRAEQPTDSETDSAVVAPAIDCLSITPDEMVDETPAQDVGDDDIDLERYTTIATTALSTLPEEAREEETKAKLITPLVQALGWNLFDSTQVRMEYTDQKTTQRPDYALIGEDSDTPDVIIEAKQLKANLDGWEQQLYDYLRVFNAEWGLLTNGEEFFVYHFPEERDVPQKLAEMEIMDLSGAQFVEELRRSNFE